MEASKSKKEDGKKDGKAKDSKDAKKAVAVAAPTAQPAPVKPKYESASQFMAMHFPNFDDEELHPEAIGPMRSRACRIRCLSFATLHHTSAGRCSCTSARA